jgi:hypothetical protein
MLSVVMLNVVAPFGTLESEFRYLNKSVLAGLASGLKVMQLFVFFFIDGISWTVCPREVISD